MNQTKTTITLKDFQVTGYAGVLLDRKNELALLQSEVDRTEKLPEDATLLFGSGQIISYKMTFAELVDLYKQRIKVLQAESVGAGVTSAQTGSDSANCLQLRATPLALNRPSHFVRFVEGVQVATSVYLSEGAYYQAIIVERSPETILKIAELLNGHDVKPEEVDELCKSFVKMATMKQITDMRPEDIDRARAEMRLTRLHQRGFVMPGSKEFNEAPKPSGLERRLNRRKGFR